LLVLSIGWLLGLGVAGSILISCGGHEAASPATGDVGARVREILADNDPLRRVQKLGDLLPNVDPSATPDVVAALDAAPLDGGDPEFVVFGMWYAQHDPQTALAWTNREWRARDGNVIAAVIRVWAHQDPKMAFGAARGLAYSPHQRLAISSAIAGWDESGKPGLVEAIRELREVDYQQAAESLARRRVITLGAEGAFRWADSLDEAVRPVMAVRVASAAALQADGAPIAGEWARPQVTKGDDRLSNFPRRIGTRWVQHDPNGAFAWLASLPDGNDRDDGVGETYRTWMKRDYRAAWAWAEEAAKTDIPLWKEPAIAVYAQAISREHPKEAIELTRRLTNVAWREPATVIIGQVWMGIDPEAARKWLEEADLPEHTRKTALIARQLRPQRMRAGSAGGGGGNELAGPAPALD
jgi:hypothetical protein